MARIDFVEVAHAYRSERSDTGFRLRATGDGKKREENSRLLPPASSLQSPVVGADANVRTDWALAPMTMSWENGGAYALLGPSGCGKTTLLNIISGLITPTRGRVLFDGTDVTHLAPQARNIAQVFQFPVVYDTMSVYENLAFPLRNRGWSAARVRARVQEIADILELTGELSRRARGLPADAKQKISLGRGLVRPDVAAILFDEPLTVIDPHLKWLLRRKLRQIHEQLRVSLIYVTHDQTEAMTFADRIVVMTHGEIVQVGSPQELYERPAHRFVGYFIGTPGMNFVDCEWHDDTAQVAGQVVVTAHTATPPPGARLSIGIRPEHLRIVEARGPNCLSVQVLSAQDQGTHTMVNAALGEMRLWIRLPERERAPSPGPAFVRLPPERCGLFADERRLA
jgi:glycerol transport system ATP-binding protein